MSSEAVRVVSQVSVNGWPPGIAQRQILRRQLRLSRLTLATVRNLETYIPHFLMADYYLFDMVYFNPKGPFQYVLVDQHKTKQWF